MSLSLNLVELAGRLTDTPELKTTPNGVYVTSFRIAVDRDYSKGEQKETDFIPVNAWRTTAEFITKYFKKGSPICIIGSIQTRTWEDTNGQKRFAVEVLADKAKFVESKSTAEQSSPYHASSPAAPSAAAPAPVQSSLPDVTDDDDLPF